METTENLSVEETPVTEAPRPRRVRTAPAKPKVTVRAVEELLAADPKKMNDAERIAVIVVLQEQNQYLRNQVQELDVSYQKARGEYKRVDEQFQRFLSEHNAKMAYVSDVVKMAYQSIKIATGG